MVTCEGQGDYMLYRIFRERLVMPKTLNIRLRPEEIDRLTRYAREKRRTKTAIVRALLQTLKPSGAEAEKRRSASI